MCAIFSRSRRQRHGELEHIKQHYYYSHHQINPTRIVPLGPLLILDARTTATGFAARYSDPLSYQSGGLRSAGEKFGDPRAGSGVDVGRQVGQPKQMGGLISRLGAFGCRAQVPSRQT
jgi:hypothetical protein